MTGINEKKAVDAGEPVEAEQAVDLSAPATQEDIQALVDGFNQVLQARDQQDYLKEEDLTKAFMMINQAIAALNAKSEIITEKLIEDGAITRDQVDNALKAKLEEASKLQKEALEKAMEQQKELAAKEA